MTQAIETGSVVLTNNEWCAVATWVVNDGDGVGFGAAVFRDLDDNAVRVTMLRADLHALAQFVDGQLPDPRSAGWDFVQVGLLASARGKIMAAASAT